VAVESRTDVRRVIFRLAWPVFAENILSTLTQVVGMIMVGRLGAAAITAVGLSFQPFFLVMGFFMGLGTGTTALVARFTGAGKPDDAARVTHQSFLLAVGLAIVFTVLTMPLARPIVALMGAEPEVIVLGTRYLLWLIPGMLFMNVSMVLSGALRGAGDTRTPMWINVMINLLNVAFCWVLIFGNLGFPALGVVGAGLAATLARVIGSVVLLAIMFSGRAAIGFDLKAFRPLSAFFKLDFEVVGRVIRIGIPAALERLVNSLGQLFYTRVVAGLGTAAFAAHSLALNVESLSYMPGIGFAVAATTLVGQNLGARRPDRAESSGWECNRLALWVMGTMGAVFFAFPAFLLRLYTPDAAVIALGVIALRVVAFAQLPEAVGFVLSGALRGAGDTKSVLWITMAGVWVVRLGLSLVFVVWLRMGLFGAWLAMGLDWVVRALYLVIRFRSGLWKEVRV
jgi:putative MATE family efflux protein